MTVATAALRNAVAAHTSAGPAHSRPTASSLTATLTDLIVGLRLIGPPANPQNDHASSSPASSSSFTAAAAAAARRDAEEALQTLLLCRLPFATTPLLSAFADAFVALISTTHDSRAAARSTVEWLTGHLGGTKGSARSSILLPPLCFVLGEVCASFAAYLLPPCAGPPLPRKDDAILAAAERLCKLSGREGDAATVNDAAPTRAAAVSAAGRLIEGAGLRGGPRIHDAVVRALCGVGSGTGSSGGSSSSSTAGGGVGGGGGAIADPSPSVRIAVCVALQSLCAASGGFATVRLDVVMSACLRLLSDPHPGVRMGGAASLASALATSVLTERVAAATAEAAAEADRVASLRGNGGGGGGGDDDDGGVGGGSSARRAGAGHSKSGAAAAAASSTFTGGDDDEAGIGGGEDGGDADESSGGGGGEGGGYEGDEGEGGGGGDDEEEDGGGRRVSNPHPAGGAAATTSSKTAASRGSGPGRKPSASSSTPSRILSRALGIDKLQQQLQKRGIGAGPSASATSAAAGGPTSPGFTLPGALRFLGALLRSAGRTAHMKGVRVGDLRVAIAAAGVALLRTTRSTMPDSELPAVLDALFSALSCAAPRTSALLPTVGGGANGSSGGGGGGAAPPHFFFSAVAASHIPIAGPHAACVRAAVAHVLCAGLLDGPPSPLSTTVAVRWEAWRATVFDSVVGEARRLTTELMRRRILPSGAAAAPAAFDGVVPARRGGVGVPVSSVRRVLPKPPGVLTRAAIRAIVRGWREADAAGIAVTETSSSSSVSVGASGGVPVRSTRTGSVGGRASSNPLATTREARRGSAAGGGVIGFSSAPPDWSLFLPAISLDSPLIDLRTATSSHELVVQHRVAVALLCGGGTFHPGSGGAAAAMHALLPSLTAALWHPSSDVRAGATAGLVALAAYSPANAPGLIVHCLSVVRAATALLGERGGGGSHVGAGGGGGNAGSDGTAGGAPSSTNIGGNSSGVDDSGSTAAIVRAGGESTAFADCLALLESRGVAVPSTSSVQSSTAATASTAPTTAAPSSSSSTLARKLATAFTSSLKGGASSSAADGGALAARLTLAAIAGPHAVPVMCHSAASPASDSLGGLGHPGAGRGSGVGVVTAGPGAALSALYTHALLLSALLSSYSDAAASRLSPVTAPAPLPTCLIGAVLESAASLLSPTRASAAAAANAAGDARRAGGAGGMAAAATGAVASTSSLAALGAAAALAELDAGLVRAGCALVCALTKVRIKRVVAGPTSLSAAGLNGHFHHANGRDLAPTIPDLLQPYIALPAVWPRIHALLGHALITLRVSQDAGGVGVFATGSGALALSPLGLQPHLAEATASAAASAALGEVGHQQPRSRSAGGGGQSSASGASASSSGGGGGGGLSAQRWESRFTSALPPSFAAAMGGHTAPSTITGTVGAAPSSSSYSSSSSSSTAGGGGRLSSFLRPGLPRPTDHYLPAGAGSSSSGATASAGGHGPHPLQHASPSSLDPDTASAVGSVSRHYAGVADAWWWTAAAAVASALKAVVAAAAALPTTYASVSSGRSSSQASSGDTIRNAPSDSADVCCSSEDADPSSSSLTSRPALTAQLYPLVRLSLALVTAARLAPTPHSALTATTDNSSLESKKHDERRLSGSNGGPSAFGSGSASASSSSLAHAASAAGMVPPTATSITFGVEAACTLPVAPAVSTATSASSSSSSSSSPFSLRRKGQAAHTSRIAAIVVTPPPPSSSSHPSHAAPHYSTESATTVSPSGVSLAAIALARRSVWHATAAAMDAAAMLPLHTVACTPLHAPMLCAAASLLSGGKVAVSPFRMALVSGLDAPPEPPLQKPTPSAAAANDHSLGVAFTTTAAAAADAFASFAATAEADSAAVDFAIRTYLADWGCDEAVAFASGAESGLCWSPLAVVLGGRAGPPRASLSSLSVSLGGGSSSLLAGSDGVGSAVFSPFNASGSRTTFGGSSSGCADDWVSAHHQPAHTPMVVATWATLLSSHAVPPIDAEHAVLDAANTAPASVASTRTESTHRGIGCEGDTDGCIHSGSSCGVASPVSRAANAAVASMCTILPFLRVTQAESFLCALTAPLLVGAGGASSSSASSSSNGSLASGGRDITTATADGFYAPGFYYLPAGAALLGGGGDGSNGKRKAGAPSSSSGDVTAPPPLLLADSDGSAEVVSRNVCIAITALAGVLRPEHVRSGGGAASISGTSAYSSGGVGGGGIPVPWLRVLQEALSKCLGSTDAPTRLLAGLGVTRLAYLETAAIGFPTSNSSGGRVLGTSASFSTSSSTVAASTGASWQHFNTHGLLKAIAASHSPASSTPPDGSSASTSSSASATTTSMVATSTVAVPAPLGRSQGASLMEASYKRRSCGALLALGSVSAASLRSVGTALNLQEVNYSDTGTISLFPSTDTLFYSPSLRWAPLSSASESAATTQSTLLQRPPLLVSKAAAAAFASYVTALSSAIDRASADSISPRTSDTIGSCTAPLPSTLHPILTALKAAFPAGASSIHAAALGSSHVGERCAALAAWADIGEAGEAIATAVASSFLPSKAAMNRGSPPTSTSITEVTSIASILLDQVVLPSLVLVEAHSGASVHPFSEWAQLSAAGEADVQLLDDGTGAAAGSRGINGSRGGSGTVVSREGPLSSCVADGGDGGGGYTPPSSDIPFGRHAVRIEFGGEGMVLVSPAASASASALHPLVVLGASPTAAVGLRYPGGGALVVSVAPASAAAQASQHAPSPFSSSITTAAGGASGGASSIPTTLASGPGGGSGLEGGGGGGSGSGGSYFVTSLDSAAADPFSPLAYASSLIPHVSSSSSSSSSSRSGGLFASTILGGDGGGSGGSGGAFAVLPLYDPSSGDIIPMESWLASISSLGYTTSVAVAAAAAAAASAAGGGGGLRRKLSLRQRQIRQQQRLSQTTVSGGEAARRGSGVVSGGSSGDATSGDLTGSADATAPTDENAGASVDDEGEGDFDGDGVDVLETEQAAVAAASAESGDDGANVSTVGSSATSGAYPADPSTSSASLLGPAAASSMRRTCALFRTHARHLRDIGGEAGARAMATVVVAALEQPASSAIEGAGVFASSSSSLLNDCASRLQLLPAEGVDTSTVRLLLRALQSSVKAAASVAAMSTSVSPDGDSDSTIDAHHYSDGGVGPRRGSPTPLQQLPSLLLRCTRAWAVLCGRCAGDVEASALAVSVGLVLADLAAAAPPLSKTSPPLPAPTVVAPGFPNKSVSSRGVTLVAPPPPPPADIFDQPLPIHSGVSGDRGSGGDVNYFDAPSDRQGGGDGAGGEVSAGSSLSSGAPGREVYAADPLAPLRALLLRSAVIGPGPLSASPSSSAPAATSAASASAVYTSSSSAAAASSSSSSSSSDDGADEEVLLYGGQADAMPLLLPPLPSLVAHAANPPLARQQQQGSVQPSSTYKRVLPSSSHSSHSTTVAAPDSPHYQHCAQLVGLWLLALERLGVTWAPTPHVSTPSQTTASAQRLHQPSTAAAVVATIPPQDQLLFPLSPPPVATVTSTSAGGVASVMSAAERAASFAYVGWSCGGGSGGGSGSSVAVPESSGSSGVTASGTGGGGGSIAGYSSSGSISGRAFPLSAIIAGMTSGLVPATTPCSMLMQYAPSAATTAATGGGGGAGAAASSSAGGGCGSSGGSLSELLGGGRSSMRKALDVRDVRAAGRPAALMYGGGRGGGAGGSPSSALALLSTSPSVRAALAPQLLECALLLTAECSGAAAAATSAKIAPLSAVGLASAAGLSSAATVGAISANGNTTFTSVDDYFDAPSKPATSISTSTTTIAGSSVALPSVGGSNGDMFSSSLGSGAGRGSGSVSLLETSLCTGGSSSSSLLPSVFVSAGLVGDALSALLSVSALPSHSCCSDRIACRQHHWARELVTALTQSTSPVATATTSTASTSRGCPSCENSHAPVGVAVAAFDWGSIARDGLVGAGVVSGALLAYPPPSMTPYSSPTTAGGTVSPYSAPSSAVGTLSSYEVAARAQLAKDIKATGAAMAAQQAEKEARVASRAAAAGNAAPTNARAVAAAAAAGAAAVAAAAATVADALDLSISSEAAVTKRYYEASYALSVVAASSGSRGGNALLGGRASSAASSSSLLILAATSSPAALAVIGLDAGLWRSGGSGSDASAASTALWLQLYASRALPALPFAWGRSDGGQDQSGGGYSRACRVCGNRSAHSSQPAMSATAAAPSPTSAECGYVASLVHASTATLTNDLAAILPFPTPALTASLPASFTIEGGSAPTLSPTILAALSAIASAAAFCATLRLPPHSLTLTGTPASLAALHTLYALVAAFGGARDPHVRDLPLLQQYQASIAAALTPATGAAAAPELQLLALPLCVALIARGVVTDASSVRALGNSVFADLVPVVAAEWVQGGWAVGGRETLSGYDGDDRNGSGVAAVAPATVPYAVVRELCIARAAAAARLWSLVCQSSEVCSGGSSSGTSGVAPLRSTQLPPAQSKSLLGHHRSNQQLQRQGGSDDTAEGGCGDYTSWSTDRHSSPVARIPLCDGELLLSAPPPSAFASSSDGYAPSLQDIGGGGGLITPLSDRVRSVLLHRVCVPALPVALCAWRGCLEAVSEITSVVKGGGKGGGRGGRCSDVSHSSLGAMARAVGVAWALQESLRQDEVYAAAAKNASPSIASARNASTETPSTLSTRQRGVISASGGAGAASAAASLRADIAAAFVAANIASSSSAVEAATGSSSGHGSSGSDGGDCVVSSALRWAVSAASAPVSSAAPPGIYSPALETLTLLLRGPELPPSVPPSLLASAVGVCLLSGAEAAASTPADTTGIDHDAGGAPAPATSSSVDVTSTAAASSVALHLGGHFPILLGSSGAIVPAASPPSVHKSSAGASDDASTGDAEEEEEDEEPLPPLAMYLWQRRQRRQARVGSASITSSIDPLGGLGSTPHTHSSGSEAAAVAAGTADAEAAAESDLMRVASAAAAAHVSVALRALTSVLTEAANSTGTTDRRTSTAAALSLAVYTAAVAALFPVAAITSAAAPTAATVAVSSFDDAVEVAAESLVDDDTSDVPFAAGDSSIASDSAVIVTDVATHSQPLSTISTGDAANSSTPCPLFSSIDNESVRKLTLAIATIASTDSLLAAGPSRPSAAISTPTPQQRLAVEQRLTRVKAAVDRVVSALRRHCDVLTVIPPLLTPPTTMSQSMLRAAVVVEGLGVDGKHTGTEAPALLPSVGEGGATDVSSGTGACAGDADNTAGDGSWSTSTFVPDSSPHVAAGILLRDCMSLLRTLAPMSASTAGTGSASFSATSTANAPLSSARGTPSTAYTVAEGLVETLAPLLQAVGAAVGTAAAALLQHQQQSQNRIVGSDDSSARHGARADDDAAAVHSTVRVPLFSSGAASFGTQCVAAAVTDCLCLAGATPPSTHPSPSTSDSSVHVPLATTVKRMEVDPLKDAPSLSAVWLYGVWPLLDAVTTAEVATAAAVLTSSSEGASGTANSDPSTVSVCDQLRSLQERVCAAWCGAIQQAIPPSPTVSYSASSALSSSSADADDSRLLITLAARGSAAADAATYLLRTHAATPALRVLMAGLGTVILGALHALPRCCRSTSSAAATHSLGSVGEGGLSSSNDSIVSLDYPHWSSVDVCSTPPTPTTTSVSVFAGALVRAAKGLFNTLAAEDAELVGATTNSDTRVVAGSAASTLSVFVPLLLPLLAPFLSPGAPLVDDADECSALTEGSTTPTTDTSATAAAVGRGKAEASTTTGNPMGWCDPTLVNTPAAALVMAIAAHSPAAFKSTLAGMSPPARSAMQSGLRVALGGDRAVTAAAVIATAAAASVSRAVGSKAPAPPGGTASPAPTDSATGTATTAATVGLPAKPKALLAFDTSKFKKAGGSLAPPPPPPPPSASVVLGSTDEKSGGGDTPSSLNYASPHTDGTSSSSGGAGHGTSAVVAAATAPRTLADWDLDGDLGLKRLEDDEDDDDEGGGGGRSAEVSDDDGGGGRQRGRGRRASTSSETYSGVVIVAGTGGIGGDDGGGATVSVAEFSANGGGGGMQDEVVAFTQPPPPPLPQQRQQQQQQHQQLATDESDFGDFVVPHTDTTPPIAPIAPAASVAVEGAGEKEEEDGGFEWAEAPPLLPEPVAAPLAAVATSSTPSLPTSPSPSSSPSASHVVPSTLVSSVMSPYHHEESIAPSPRITADVTSYPADLADDVTPTHDDDAAVSDVVAPAPSHAPAAVEEPALEVFGNIDDADDFGDFNDFDHAGGASADVYVGTVSVDVPSVNPAAVPSAASFVVGSGAASRDDHQPTIVAAMPSSSVGAHDEMPAVYVAAAPTEDPVPGAEAGGGDDGDSDDFGDFTTPPPPPPAVVTTAAVGIIPSLNAADDDANDIDDDEFAEFEGAGDA